MNLLQQTRQISSLVSTQKPVFRTASMHITPSDNLTPSTVSALSASSLDAVNTIKSDNTTFYSPNFTVGSLLVHPKSATSLSTFEFDREIAVIRAAVEVAAVAQEQQQKESENMSLLTPLHSANLKSNTNIFNFETTSVLLPSPSSLKDLSPQSLNSGIIK